MATWFWIGLGGALGSVSRYGVGRWSQAAWPAHLPVGVLLVNALGSFLMGLLTAVFVEVPVSDTVRHGVLTGVLGGFTTYSAFNQDTFAFLHRGDPGLAVVNVLATLVVCLALGALGHVAGRALVG